MSEVVGSTKDGDGVRGTSDAGGAGVRGISKDKHHAGIRGENSAFGPAGSFVGEVRLINPTDHATVVIDPMFASITLGANGTAGLLIVTNDKGKQVINIRGDSGDIALFNGDCAEEFDVVNDTIEPGTVMVLGQGEQLVACAQPYDRRVAGVISGMGDLRPALTLGARPPSTSRKPLALTGRVLCKVDADAAPIEVGDLLTTSTIEGHAMKVTDPARAFGAVIGKALRPIESGRGLIPILVALQ